MAAEIDRTRARNDATAPLPPGPVLRIGKGTTEVVVAPEAGGRIAQIVHAGVAQLIGPEDGWPATIGWGCYPMLPWVGRIRRGRFRFDGRAYALPTNFGGHAIHGVGFALPWRVEVQTHDSMALSLALPADAEWPFGGTAAQRIEVVPGRVRLTLSLTAGAHAMPAEIGWHPWFRKPERVDFAPTHVYPRDDDGIATRPLAPALPGPWDDCFPGGDDIVLYRGEQRLRLRSDCDHRVVYDAAPHATCVEPQSGPPDAFNLAPRRLAPGERLTRWFELVWA
ncbi:aldose epimerase [Luteimonas sp. RC10]|uniref:aldose epimerase family protein n=1 Tax=Luteimonas sp. RC10 TaxID=2587035 RepID=UPI0016120882|nr:aldose epimerase [Luteimonas sp. RC10]MBB3343429.1 aldose 1-epimerase [Luteimonas sp. RC10]